MGRAGKSRERAVSARKKAGSDRPTSRRTLRRPADRAAEAPKVVPRPPAELSVEERRALVQAAWVARLQADGARPWRDGPVAIYTRELTSPRVAWQLITAGLGERGFELVLVTPRRQGEAQPPGWAPEVLVALTKVAAIADPGAVPAGQSLTLAAAIATGTDPLASFALVPAAMPAPITTAGGTVRPLLVVGLTPDEARVIREWSPQAFVELLAHADPALATDPERSSLLQSPRARSLIEQRVEREGSSLQIMEVLTSQIVGRPDGATIWKLPPDAIDLLVCLIKGRTGHRRPFTVRAAEGVTVEVVPSDRGGLTVEGPGKATLSLSLTAARQLRANLRPRKGHYWAEAIPAVVIEVA